MAASLAGLATSASRATAAAPQLADLVRPLVLKMDVNGDGLLDLEEIRGALQRSGGASAPREAIINDIMAPIDFNDDGDVSVDEFARGMALELEVDERWMRLMAADAKAGLTEQELAAGLGNLGPMGNEVLPVAFKMADANRDGRLSQKEASKAMALISSGVLGSYYDETAGI